MHNVGRYIMFVSCADGTDDDLFWMYFTVSSDEGAGGGDGGDEREVTVSAGANGLEGGERQGGDGDAWRETTIGSADQVELNAAVERRDGRRGGGDAPKLAGTSPPLTVVTNDEMRNHRMALLEPVPFYRLVVACSYGITPLVRCRTQQQNQTKPNRAFTLAGGG